MKNLVHLSSLYKYHGYKLGKGYKNQWLSAKLAYAHVAENQALLRAYHGLALISVLYRRGWGGGGETWDFPHRPKVQFLPLPSLEY